MGCGPATQSNVLNPQTLAAQFAAQNVKVIGTMTGTTTNGVVNATFIVPVPLQKKPPSPPSPSP